MTTPQVIPTTDAYVTGESSSMVYCEKCEVIVNEEHRKLGHPLLKLFY